MAKLQLMVPNQCPRDDRFMEREKKERMGSVEVSHLAPKIRQVF